MKRSLTALALVLTMAGTLTACGNRDNTAGSGGANSVPQSRPEASVGQNGTASGSGAGGSSAGQSGPATGSVSGSGSTASAGQAGYTTGRAGYDRKTSNNERLGTDDWLGNRYFMDGRYRTDGNGSVAGSDGAGRDLTDAARDMIRGTENALKDVGGGVRGAVRDVTGM